MSATVSPGRVRVRLLLDDAGTRGIAPDLQRTPDLQCKRFDRSTIETINTECRSCHGVLRMMEPSALGPVYLDLQG